MEAKTIFKKKIENDEKRKIITKYERKQLFLFVCQTFKRLKIKCVLNSNNEQKLEII